MNDNDHADPNASINDLHLHYNASSDYPNIAVRDEIEVCHYVDIPRTDKDGYDLAGLLYQLNLVVNSGIVPSNARVFNISDDDDEPEFIVSWDTVE